MCRAYFNITIEKYSMESEENNDTIEKMKSDIEERMGISGRWDEECDRIVIERAVTLLNQGSKKKVIIKEFISAGLSKSGAKKTIREAKLHIYESNSCEKKTMAQSMPAAKSESSDVSTNKQSTSLAFWIILIGVISAIILYGIETDEQLLTKMNTGMASGSFRNQPKALKAVSKLLRRGHARAKDPRVVDRLITTGALLLTDNAEWIDKNEAKRVYNLLKRYDDKTVVDGLVRKVIRDTTNRLHVLFLGIKLGIPGSQERLNQILDKHGDIKMAEDFLNSGSSELYEGGKQWANNHGCSIMSGMGSHRASWGNF